MDVVWHRLNEVATLIATCNGSARHLGACLLHAEHGAPPVDTAFALSLYIGTLTDRYLLCICKMAPIVRHYIAFYLLCSMITATLLLATTSILIAVLSAVNFLAFCYMGIDKHAARAGRERVPETLFLVAAILGAGPGILFGGYLFRHKTRKTSFTLPVVTITTLYLLLVSYLYREGAPVAVPSVFN